MLRSFKAGRQPNALWISAGKQGNMKDQQVRVNAFADHFDPSFANRHLRLESLNNKREDCLVNLTDGKFGQSKAEEHYQLKLYPNLIIETQFFS